VILRSILAGFTKNRSNIKKAKAKPKAGPKGNVKKMMNGGKVMGYKDGGPRYKERQALWP
jgi:hypothetical protein